MEKPRVVGVGGGRWASILQSAGSGPSVQFLEASIFLLVSAARFITSHDIARTLLSSCCASHRSREAGSGEEGAGGVRQEAEQSARSSLRSSTRSSSSRRRRQHCCAS